MNAGVRVDALVRGRVGHTDRVETIRVTAVSPFGWVAGVNLDGNQRVINPGFEILGEPRPEKLRTDIPAHLRGQVAKAVPA
jgi:hypothetical protein